MLTQEQAHAASLALLPDLEKYNAFRQYKQACKGMDRYGLPFRVYLDYLKRPNTKIPGNQCHVKINPLYPNAGYRTDEVLSVCPDDFIPRDTETDSASWDESNYTFEDLKPEMQKEITKRIDPVRVWKQYDKNWEYYFLHFLKGYDIQTFTEFDFYGVHGEHTHEDIQLLKSVYERLQRVYERSPHDYMNDEPIISASEYVLYQDEPYYFCLSRDKAIERDNLIEKHKQGYEYTDTEYLFVYGIGRNGFDYIGEEETGVSI